MKVLKELQPTSGILNYTYCFANGRMLKVVFSLSAEVAIIFIYLANAEEFIGASKLLRKFGPENNWTCCLL